MPSMFMASAFARNPARHARGSPPPQHVARLAPDDDTDALAQALAPGTTTSRTDLSEERYEAYRRFAERLAAAATTGWSGGDRALFGRRC